MGDPSGIGPAITLQAVSRLRRLADFVVIGDAFVLERAGGKGALRLAGADLVDLRNVVRARFRFGCVRAEYGRSSVDYLDAALELLRTGALDCLVTCPVSKESVHKAGMRFSGHTEFLAERTRTKSFVMMLMNRSLRISLVTRHTPLREVPDRIDARALCDTIAITHRALRESFGIAQPRIVIAGLNPHASDNGLLGKEENAVIKPFLRSLGGRVPRITGPLSADVAMLEAKKGLYDCVIAMYHDQALIALKLTGADTGVNMTLGLPFVRTSPLHGTAFDIAGTSSADPSSLIEAIKAAVRCAKRSGAKR